MERDNLGRFIKGHKRLSDKSGFQIGHKPYDGMLGKKHTKKTKLLISRKTKENNLKGLCGFKKGHKFYPGTKLFIKGFVPWNKNKLMPMISGRKHPFWKGGKSYREYSSKFNKLLKRKIKERYNYKCILCNAPEEECLTNLHIHHIDYNKKNNKEHNLVSLCRKCHLKTNHKREYWYGYFMDYMGRVGEIAPRAWC